MSEQKVRFWRWYGVGVSFQRSCRYLLFLVSERHRNENSHTHKCVTFVESMGKA